jgi:hypothetical protein
MPLGTDARDRRACTSGRRICGKMGNERTLGGPERGPIWVHARSIYANPLYEEFYPVTFYVAVGMEGHARKHQQ